MRFTNLCIDVSNLYWRNCSISLKEKIDLEKDEVYANTILMTINKINSLISEFGAYKDCKIYLLFDNPLSKINIRKEIDPLYKHARIKKEMPKYFYRTLDILWEILEVYSDRFNLVKIPNLEADDIVHPLLKYLGNDSCLLITADMDWGRSINDFTCWYNFHTLYTIDSFKTKYGFYPKNNSVTLYKALHGDNSDNIDNAVPYLPKEILYDICNRFNDADDLFKNLFSKEINYPQNWKLKIKENELKIRMNYYLCDFIEIDGDITEYIKPCKESVKALRSWYKMLNIPLESRMKTAGDLKDKKDNFFKVSYPKR